MAMRKAGMIVGAMSLVLLVGCSDNDAKVLFENAAFEESHMNYENAKRIYEQIIARYPTSKEAEIAKARLQDLEKSEEKK
jgi:outer membrane protein assembly factor BamD (BamD/ComL family)